MTQDHALTTLLETAREQGAFRAAQSAVFKAGALVHRSAHGTLCAETRNQAATRSLTQRTLQAPPAEITHRTRMDAASLTKVLATTPIAMVLVDRGVLDLDASVQRYLPAFRHAHITPRMLLGHRSGLAAWAPLFEQVRADPVAATLYPGLPGVRNFGWSRELMHHAVLTQDPSSAPGPRVYSDIGFLTLGMLLERVGAAPLDRLAQELVFGPLGLTHTGYVRLQGNAVPQGEFVGTGLTRPRAPAPGQAHLYSVHPQPDSLRAGEVDDDNAYAMGGVAGHAGVFSTATDVARFGQALLEERRGAGKLASAQLVQEFLAPDAPASLPVRSLGFDRVAAQGSTAGSLLGQGEQGGVGHLGFTGCSLWVDLDREVVAALLTNRVFPSRGNVDGIRAVRPRFHDLVVGGRG